MLSLVIAESALELVPLELQRHNSVTASAKRFNKKPSEILLDISWHFAAMKGIKNEIKRGRPDLVHFSLLEACSIPLYFENKVNVFVHTIDDKVIFIGQNVRLPKSYHRFIGLVEKLYAIKEIKENNNVLLALKNMSFGNLIKKINPEQTIALSSKGIENSYQKLANEIKDNTCLIIGGFSKGHFSDNISKYFDKTVSVDKNPLEAHIIISRILYEYEKRIIM
ncbi:ribosome biogenesis protein [Candidatus Nitrosotalea okcheonensis]|uniref:Ribosomal RNA small subunit methyltransferase Nep1 n=1 Tax=Candidatus Nitrosotalea okcheonensis TaxID=1903276 RepID=A0A2H1FGP3_9ARCH|nr:ribosome biogenesis protein [Candidatus Nitrosotalea okcheonensis]SMH71941.1 Ribosomal RNA small subunit methyltransferase Nep1 [Candidatus Nitrosotalea okcheonensis]